MLVNSFLHSCASAFIKHTPALARLSTVLKHVHCFSSLYRTMAYSTTERGGPNTLGYRVFFKNAAGVAVSPFHDIPLVANPEKGTYNMVVEIPRWTNAKMELKLSEEYAAERHIDLEMT